MHIILDVTLSVSDIKKILHVQFSASHIEIVSAVECGIFDSTEHLTV
jgi:hypothetical protein